MTTFTMEMKQAFKAASVTMQFEDGGRTQVLNLDGTAYRLPGGMHTAEIIATIKHRRDNVI